MVSQNENVSAGHYIHMTTESEFVLMLADRLYDLVAAVRLEDLADWERGNVNELGQPLECDIWWKLMTDGVAYIPTGVEQAGGVEL